MPENIQERSIKSEVESSYIDYAMSVIIGRALPDIRDGLKPVHRRILYVMHREGILPNKRFVKSANVVGMVLGKFHPHGDGAVYDSIVRMAQEFSMRYPLVHGQGNFGSIDGDPAAAYRYTEAKLSKIAVKMLEDIDKDTVDFIPNFDETTLEPTVLPALLPNFLLNGSSGIAVGMATNVPPHNLGEIVEALVHVIDNPESSVDELFQFIKGPDFPTGAIVTGISGIHDMYRTGRGRIIMQAKASIEEAKGGKAVIIVSEIPYMVNKSNLIEAIAKCADDGIITGISDIRDESNKNGIRVVIELKRDAIPKVVLNLLYKHTQMRTTFGAIMLAIDKGRPKEFNLKEILGAYLDHRRLVVRRRTEHLLAKAQRRAHILEGLKIAVDNIELIIELIKTSPNPDTAKERLKEKFNLSTIQVQAILEMQLQRLTGLERSNIEAELKEKYKEIEQYQMILSNPREIERIIRNELLSLKEDFSEPRRTIIVASEEEIDPEDLIPKEDIVISMTHSGYIKRLNQLEIRTQRRGGRGSTGMKTKEDDFVEKIFTSSTHSYLLVFTSIGKCYWLKGYDIPEGTKQSKGRSIAQLLPMTQDEKIKSIVCIDDFDDKHFVFMATKKGIVKKSNLSLYSNPRSSGIIAVNLEEGDDLIYAGLTSGKDKVFLATKDGKCITFNESDARSIGRNTIGVIGIRLEGDDHVVGAAILASTESIFTVTEKGIGKRTPSESYRVQSRGGKGIINIKLSDRSGCVVAVKQVSDDDEVMVISKNGIMIKMRMSDFREIGRNTQGVRVINLDKEDSVVSFEKSFIENDEE